MKKVIGFFVVTLLIATAVSQVSACTGFTYDDENNVFACHNEDWHDFFNIRFFPASEGKYGRMFIEVFCTLEDGTDMMMPFTGLSDQGLFMSGYGTPYLEVVNSSGKPVYYDPDLYYKRDLGEKCMAECATVEEAYALTLQYNLEGMEYCQILVADATGVSVICEGDDYIFKEGNYQVVSNFLQSHPELGGLGNAFERYDIAVSMLETMTVPSVEYFRDILNATHQKKYSSWTCHSIVCDLSNQIMYLYYCGDYETQVVIDLNEELTKGEHCIYLGSLFEPDGNQPPAKPDPPTGNESGIPGDDIEYRVVKTSDPDGDRISYCFDWGDGNQSLWLFRTSGSIGYSHSWSERGTYEVKVKARDEYGAESEWSDPLIVSMPKPKSINPLNPQFIEKLLEHFPLLARLLHI